MVVTDDAALANRMRIFRNQGITTDHRQRSQCGSWFYEMVDLGYNYRISDFQCALGSAQLRKLPARLERRRQLANRYAQSFSGADGAKPLGLRSDSRHAWHLYVILLGGRDDPGNRDRVFRHMREAGIGVNVHYIPVHLHPYYRQAFRTAPGLCPEAESAYKRILSLPMFPQMSDGDVDYVTETLMESLR
jgi:perosamine synthetase